MTLNINATMTFKDYVINDSGVTVHFECLYPGPEMPTDYYILVTDAEMAAVSSLNQGVNLITTKLNRKIRAVGIASKLDQLIGRSVVI